MLYIPYEHEIRYTRDKRDTKVCPQNHFPAQLDMPLATTCFFTCVFYEISFICMLSGQHVSGL